VTGLDINKINCVDKLDDVVRVDFRVNENDKYVYNLKTLNDNDIMIKYVAGIIVGKKMKESKQLISSLLISDVDTYWSRKHR
jgi:hypothetical protein